MCDSYRALTSALARDLLKCVAPNLSHLLPRYLNLSRSSNTYHMTHHSGVLRTAISSCKSIGLAVLRNVFPFHAAAWRTAQASLYDILNATDDALLISRLERWQKSMQAQLANSGIIV